MAILKVCGTKKGAEIHLAQTRKATDSAGNILPKKAGEVDYTTEEGKLIEYRRRISNNLNGFQLNKIKSFDFTGDNKGTKFSLIVTDTRGRVHILDIGGSMAAKSVINGLCSLHSDEYTSDALMDARFDFSVYVSKKGYNSMAIKMNDELLDWVLSSDEQKSLIEVTETRKGKIVDDTDLINALKEFIPKVNAKLPHANVGGSDGFDELDDDTPVDDSEKDTPFESAEEEPVDATLDQEF